MAAKKAKSTRRPGQKSGGKYRCRVASCAEDVTPLVEAMLAAGDTATAQMTATAQITVMSVALKTVDGAVRMNLSSGTRTLIATCSKGHRTVFSV